MERTGTVYMAENESGKLIVICLSSLFLEGEPPSSLVETLQAREGRRERGKERATCRARPTAPRPVVDGALPDPVPSPRQEAGVLGPLTEATEHDMRIEAKEQEKRRQRQDQRCRRLPLAFRRWR